MEESKNPTPKTRGRPRKIRTPEEQAELKKHKNKQSLDHYYLKRAVVLEKRRIQNEKLVDIKLILNSIRFKLMEDDELRTKMLGDLADIDLIN